eukprot:3575001-Prymnesium_polylepis.1
MRRFAAPSQRLRLKGRMGPVRSVLASAMQLVHARHTRVKPWAYRVDSDLRSAAATVILRFVKY